MAAAATTTTAAFTMKLFINTRARRVLFAETTRGVIDFLYSLLNSDDTPIPFDDVTFDGCMDNIAESVSYLDDLDAEAATGSTSRRPPPPQQPRRRFFVCGGKRGAGGCAGYVAKKSGVRCPSCGEPIVAEAPPGAPGAGCSWQAPPPPPPQPRQPLTCTLMDDLSIGPKLETALAVVTMKGTKLQEKTVRVGYEEGLEILIAALQSSSVLTDVFLQREAPAAGAPS
ncbi:unnamed protein product [Urochloa decumbens]|uniref:Uncharacterized protein n=1 Tax=Urochloa decumbens TaxID=240449 RepID=A0ABC9AKH3_9POAL